MSSLSDFIDEHSIKAELLTFGQSTHSVAEAALAVGASEDQFIKSICMQDKDGNPIVAIVKGEHRASTKRVKKALGKDDIHTASPEQVEELTGFPCGGTPPFGFRATFLIDPKVMEMEQVYGGGGDSNSLIRISPKEMQRANRGEIRRVRK
jgi:prolyl-tRNA editing enzyme YbaK/EbsC (Cys-tRNA(Pro) deacylase)